MVRVPTGGAGCKLRKVQCLEGLLSQEASRSLDSRLRNTEEGSRELSGMVCAAQEGGRLGTRAYQLRGWFWATVFRTSTPARRGEGGPPPVGLLQILGNIMSVPIFSSNRSRPRRYRNHLLGCVPIRPRGAFKFPHWAGP